VVCRLKWIASLLWSIPASLDQEQEQIHLWVNKLWRSGNVVGIVMPPCNPAGMWLLDARRLNDGTLPAGHAQARCKGTTTDRNFNALLLEGHRLG